MPVCLHIAYGCFHTAKAELSSCDKNHTAHEAENIYYLALYRKFANPCSRWLIIKQGGWV